MSIKIKFPTFFPLSIFKIKFPTFLPLASSRSSSRLSFLWHHQDQILGLSPRPSRLLYYSYIIPRSIHFPLIYDHVIRRRKMWNFFSFIVEIETETIAFFLTSEYHVTLFPNNLEIIKIDVGQGDDIWILTTTNQTVTYNDLCPCIQVLINSCVFRGKKISCSWCSS